MAGTLERLQRENAVLRKDIEVLAQENRALKRQIEESDRTTSAKLSKDSREGVISLPQIGREFLFSYPGNKRSPGFPDLLLTLKRMVPGCFHDMVKAYSPYPTEVDPVILDSLIDFRLNGPLGRRDQKETTVTIVIEFRGWQILPAQYRIKGRKNFPKKLRVEYLKPGSQQDWLDPVNEKDFLAKSPERLLRVPPGTLQPSDFLGLRIQGLREDGRPDLIDLVGFEVFGTAFGCQ
jgi:hypothetical protein